MYTQFGWVLPPGAGAGAGAAGGAPLAPEPQPFGPPQRGNRQPDPVEAKVAVLRGSELITALEAFCR